MNSRRATTLARTCCAIVATMILNLTCGASAAARNYLFENISDLPAGPGSGRSAEINDDGDIAFLNDETVWFYDRSANSFLNVTSLPGAPAHPFFVKLNNSGDIAIVETPTTSRDLWLFERDTQAFTNIGALPNYPGDSLANFALTAFDLNDHSQISFHSGDNNFGDVYVYDHESGDFDRITGMPGGPLHGRENEVNNSGQVLYMGFPSTYLYDPVLGTTTNINTLPGGPGPALTNLDLNDHGDVALMSAAVAQFYDAGTGTFLDDAATSGWPPNDTASSRSDLSNSGDITFWREGLYAFDTTTHRFSKLNGFPGGPPAGGTETDLNSSGQDVDARDFLAWQRGESPDPLSAVDYADWTANFGTVAPAPIVPATGVPEPKPASLLIMSAVGIHRCRGRAMTLGSAIR
jgi:hypothetical protein